MSEGEPRRDRQPIRVTVAHVRYAQRDLGVAYPPHYRSILDALELAGCAVTSVAVPSRMFVFRGLGKSLLYVSPRAVSILARSRPEIILALEYNLGLLWAVLAAKRARARVWVFQENAGYAGYPLGGLRKVLRRWLAPFIDRFLANTTAAADEIVGTLGAASDRVLQAPLLVPPAREVLLARPIDLPDPPMRPVFLFVGRLDARKNLNALLEASFLLAPQRLEFCLWIVGDGPLRERYARTARELGLENRIRFFPWVPHESLGFLYESGDVFVMPSLRDYRSVSVLEAMRFGKPVLDSRLDGNAGDPVRDGISGFLFDPRRPAELARCMASLIREPRLIKEMGQRAEDMMRREYVPEVAAKRLRPALGR